VFQNPAGLTSGFHTAVLIAGGAAAAGGLLAAATIRNPPRKRAAAPPERHALHCALDAPPLRSDSETPAPQRTAG